MESKRRSWEQWNAALWVGNDEPLYRTAIALDRAQFISWCEEFFPETPDGAPMNAENAGHAWDCMNEDRETA